MKTVKEVSRLSGVSVRALHHYDAIGLLKPTAVTPAGYRLYDEAAIARLQTILLFRELDFPLKTIKVMLDNPAFDREDALCRQIDLLKARRERLDKLIALADNTLKQGECTMDFSAFDKQKEEEYRKEVREKWGNTDAYAEYEARDADTPRTGYDAGLAEQFVRFGALKGKAPDCREAQEQVAALQQYITDRYYTCTKQILAGLGLMYTADERFRTFIDSVGGEGTAAFAGEAIALYCRD